MDRTKNQGLTLNQTKNRDLNQNKIKTKKHKIFLQKHIKHQEKQRTMKNIQI
jgi:hypothetical protein